MRACLRPWNTFTGFTASRHVYTMLIIHFTVLRYHLLRCLAVVWIEQERYRRGGENERERELDPLSPSSCPPHNCIVDDRSTNFAKRHRSSWLQPWCASDSWNIIKSLFLCDTLFAIKDRSNMDRIGHVSMSSLRKNHKKTQILCWSTGKVNAFERKSKILLSQLSLTFISRGYLEIPQNPNWDVSALSRFSIFLPTAE